MKWKLKDGRTVTYDDGVLEGDDLLTDQIIGFINDDAMLEDPVLGTPFIAGWDTNEQASVTITAILLMLVGAENLVEAPGIGEPNSLDSFALVEPSDASLARTGWATSFVRIMEKARQRRFGSRSEAGRYAAYVRWSRQQGVEPVGVAEWQQMQTPTATESMSTDAMADEIRGLIRDLQPELEDFRKRCGEPDSDQVQLLDPIEVDQMLGRPKGRPHNSKILGYTAEEYAQLSKILEERGKPGVYVRQGDGRVFVPTQRTLDLMKKTQEIGSKIDNMMNKAIEEAGLSEQYAKIKDLGNRLWKKEKDAHELVEGLPWLKQINLADKGSQLLPVVGELIPAMDAIRAVKLSVLKQVTDIGIKPPLVVTKTLFAPDRYREDLITEFQDRMDQASQRIPSRWQKAIDSVDYLHPDIADKNAFGQRGPAGQRESVIFYSKSPDLPFRRSVGMKLADKARTENDTGILSHELTHAAEAYIPSLAVMNDAFLGYRVIGTKPSSPNSFANGTTPPLGERMTKVDVRNTGYGEFAPDHLTETYAGILYQHNGREILSVGADHVFMTQPLLGRVGVIDADYSSFVLGQLAVGG